MSDRSHPFSRREFIAGTAATAAALALGNAPQGRAAEGHHLAVVCSGRSKPDGDPEIYCYVDGQLEPVTRHSSDKAPMDSGGNLIVDTDTTSPNAQRLCLFSNPHWGGAIPEHGFTLPSMTSMSSRPL